MVKKIMIGLFVVVFVFLGFVALQPNDFRITRSIAISAPPQVVFERVNDFHNWEHWSPWSKMDPTAKNTFEGAAAGQGAQFSWAGNDKVGEGRMTITESRPSELVRIQLDFLKPFAATNTTEFTLVSEGSQTRITWTMFGSRPFLAKLCCLFMNMDKMVGGEFEKGLADMKTVSEKLAAT